MREEVRTGEPPHFRRARAPRTVCVMHRVARTTQCLWSAARIRRARGAATRARLVLGSGTTYPPSSIACASSSPHLGSPAPREQSASTPPPWNQRACDLWDAALEAVRSKPGEAGAVRASQLAARLADVSRLASPVHSRESLQVARHITASLISVASVPSATSAIASLWRGTAAASKTATTPSQLECAIEVFRLAASASPQGIALALGVRGHVMQLRRVLGRAAGKGAGAGSESDSGALASAAAELDEALRQLLGTWFGRGMLELRRVTWEQSSGYTLERIATAETVHPTDRLWRFKRRFGPGRRCYALFHPSAPADPVVFIHTALTAEVADGIGSLTRMAGAVEDSEDVRTSSSSSSSTSSSTSSSSSSSSTSSSSSASLSPPSLVGEDRRPVAMAWSIGNSVPALQGLNVARHLIYSVIDDLRTTKEVRGLFTLSPVPGFAKWLVRHVRDSRMFP